MTAGQKIKFGKWASAILIMAFAFAANFMFDEFVEDGGLFAKFILFAPTVLGLYGQLFDRSFLAVLVTNARVRSFFLLLFGILSLAPTAIGKFYIYRYFGGGYYNMDWRHMLMNEFLPFTSAFLAISALILLLSTMENAAEHVKPASHLLQNTAITICVSVTAFHRTTLYGLNMREYSVNNLNQMISVMIYVAYTYYGSVSLWHLFSKAHSLRSAGEWRLTGRQQLLPWAVLIFPLTCLYSLNMYGWFNLLAVILIPVLMAFSYVSFSYKNSMVPVVCGAVIAAAYIFLIMNFAPGQSRLLFMFVGFILLLLAPAYAFVVKPLPLAELKNCKINIVPIFITLARQFRLLIAYLIIAAIVLFKPAVPFSRDWLAQYTDVTERYIGKIITIQSLAEGEGAYLHYVSNDFHKGQYIHANRIEAGYWERFKVERGKHSWNQGCANFITVEEGGRYVSAMLNRDPSPLIGESLDPTQWQSFRILEKDGAQYIVTMLNTVFLTVNCSAANNPVEAGCDTEEPGAWERFSIKIVGSYE